ncbi:hypothetical protein [uncultured Chitinophaga sp.]|uniref:hypothetical protein n=1 Tax=uncultured Chitinophaga sp. TaxID=339340 RepID=UPI0025E8682B|nr:hypothetical protein [uncultured Chitinophaga sp.]
MKLRYIILILSGLSVTLFCCKKVEEGYLSDRMEYMPFTLIATQGAASYTTPIPADGSTLPLKVKLLEIRSKATGKALDSATLQPREVPIYLAELTAADTTIELINKKITRGMKRPIDIATIGGRIIVSPAASFLDTGRYEFDVEVSNMRGTRVFKNAGNILIAPKTWYTITRQTRTSSPVGAETDFQNIGDGSMPMTIDRYPDAPNKLVFKFVDTKGVPFNPKNGEIILRGDRAHFKLYNPFFPEVKTDTALEFQHPNLTRFPFFTQPNGETSSYYRIPGAFNTINRNVNATFGITFFGSGTYIVTMQTGVERKP